MVSAHRGVVSTSLRARNAVSPVLSMVRLGTHTAPDQDPWWKQCVKAQPRAASLSRLGVWYSESHRLWMPRYVRSSAIMKRKFGRFFSPAARASSAAPTCAAVDFRKSRRLIMHLSPDSRLYECAGRV